MRNVELTLKEIFISVLHRWKLVLLIALVCAAAVGGYNYSTLSAGLGELQDAYETQQAAYTENLAAKRSSIAHFKDIVNAARMYSDNSLLMKVDPYNKRVASLTLSVEVDPDSITLDLSDQKTLGLIDLRDSLVSNLISRYLIIAGNARLSEVWGGVIPEGIGETYLREVVSVDRYVDKDLLPGGEGILTISVTGVDGLDEEVAVDKIYQYLLEKKPLLESTIHAHTLTVLDQSKLTSVDTQLADVQAAQRNLVADTSNKIEVIYQEIETLNNERPSAPSLTSNMVKSAILGFLLGFVLGVVLAVLLYLAKMPVQFASQIQSQLGVRFLGGIKPKKKGFCVTRLKNRLAGEQLLQDEPDGFRLAGANVAQLAGEHRRVLVTGTLPEQDITRAAQRLSAQLEGRDVTLIPSAGVNQSADAVNGLAESDAVVFVERLQQSRLRDVLMEKERVELADKPVLGYVLV